MAPRVDTSAPAAAPAWGLTHPAAAFHKLHRLLGIPPIWCLTTARAMGLLLADSSGLLVCLEAMLRTHAYRFPFCPIMRAVPQM